MYLFHALYHISINLYKNIKFSSPIYFQAVFPISVKYFALFEEILFYSF